MVLDTVLNGRDELLETNTRTPIQALSRELAPYVWRYEDRFGGDYLQRYAWIERLMTRPEKVGMTKKRLYLVKCQLCCH